MSIPPTQVSRRGVIAGAVALSACRPAGPAFAPPTTLQQAVAGAWRTPQDRQRDAWRHPLEALAFWGLKPGQTVVEFWPGGGWYADILAPFLAATHGRYIAVEVEPSDAAARAAIEAFRRRLEAKPKL